MKYTELDRPFVVASTPSLDEAASPWDYDYFGTRAAAEDFAQARHEAGWIWIIGELGIYSNTRGNAVLDYLYTRWNGWFDFDSVEGMGVPYEHEGLHVEYKPLGEHLASLAIRDAAKVGAEIGA